MVTQQSQAGQFEELICQGAEIMAIGLDPDRLAGLRRYFDELKRWSAKVNLIARESGDAVIIENHFLDSLALLHLLEPGRDHLLDIGSGAGFPGLVCKIARPQLRVGLVEPRLKRVSFLRHIVRTCGLDQIAVEAQRLEPGVRLPDESAATCVVSRAVADIGEFLVLCDRFRRPGCRVVCMKGPRFTEELAGAAEALAGWELAVCRQYMLPFSGAERALLVFQPGPGEPGDRQTAA